MKCKIEGCEKEVRYQSACLCQKHYFRLRRNGDFDLHRPIARPRIEDPRGYQFVHAPNHPLCRSGQIYVAEHRVVLYAAIGPGPMSCEMCRSPLTWDTCQADHIDENPRNNERSNLRPLCRRCNTWRSMPPAAIRRKDAVVLSFDGETKTANEWARDVRVKVSGSAIKRRKRLGASDEEALFGEKVTHNGNLPKPYQPKTNAKHERSNAVAIAFNGVVRTAAEWAREPQVSVGASGLIWRIRQGWSVERALFQKGRFA